jgi:hypothetical protein
MPKSWTTPGARDDENVLDDLLRHVTPAIGDVVGILHAGTGGAAVPNAPAERQQPRWTDGASGPRLELGGTVSMW